MTLTPAQLEECLSIVRWSPDALAQALECDLSVVHAWLNDEAEIPIKVGSWIELLTTCILALEQRKPEWSGMEGAMAGDTPDIAAELAFMAEHPDRFTKKEMAAMLAAASVVIEDLRLLVGIREDIELENVEPEGNA